MVLGGCGSIFWVNGGIGWRWGLLGRGSICVHLGLLEDVGNKKRGVGSSYL